jgi:hypothetical protein
VSILNLFLRFFDLILEEEFENKGNNKITELRTMLQRESQNSLGVIIIRISKVTSGAGTAHPSRTHEVNRVFSFIFMLCWSFVLFLLAIALSVLLRYTDYDYS